MDHSSEFAADRYLHLWNEPDAPARRRLIEELWAPGGSNSTPARIAVGYDEIETRVTASFTTYVGTGVYRFRPARPTVSHHGTVLVSWEMERLEDATVASVGLEFLTLDDAGRVISDHQFLLV
jgi:hypothetical protein